MIQNSGLILSHSDKDIHKKLADFKFDKGQIVRISYDPINKKVVFLNKTTNTTTSLNIIFE